MLTRLLNKSSTYHRRKNRLAKLHNVTSHDPPYIVIMRHSVSLLLDGTAITAKIGYGEWRVLYRISNVIVVACADTTNQWGMLYSMCIEVLLLHTHIQITACT
jgi:hypothetical protein